jgi:hypothetical protein
MSTFLFGDDWKVNLARGKLRNAFHVHKFGANFAPANGVEESVWDGSTIYPWATTWDLGAATVHLKSDDADDAGITVFIQGLDADYNLQSEVVTLDATDPSTTSVASQNTYTRLFRMYNTSSQQEVGNISAHYASAGGTKIAQITATHGQTLMAIYTVPAGHVALCTEFDFAGSANASLSSRLMVRPFGNVFRNQHQAATYGGQYHKDYNTPLVFTEKSDIDVRVTAGTGSATISATFELVIIKDNEFALWSQGY